MAQLITTLGPMDATAIGFVLPHEHIFVDFRSPEHPEHGHAAIADVVALMAPEVSKAQALGVTAMVDCTPVGVGRRADILQAITATTGMPLVVPTGIYREPQIPAWAHAASETTLTNWMIGELTHAIDGSDVQAGWIKLGVSDDAITECEAKILRAAARAGRETNDIIGVHTKRGRIALEQLDIIEAAGYTAERFIWIHTQADPESNYHLAVARRGAWIEYDCIGAGDDSWYIDHIQHILAAGFGHQLMLSHDRGWYDPAKPHGGEPKPFTHTNPFRAFAR
jgi:phosphotriesterase-related protein